MLVGIPKEILCEEKRVAATPETVQKYVELGFQVAVESAAGEGIGIGDEEYRRAGATLVSEAERLFAEADLVLKVKQPILNEKAGKHEAQMLKSGSMLITFLHPAAPENHEMIKVLRDRNITSLTMDGIPRISRAQRMDALSSMSSVTGYKAVLMAANHFPKFVPMMSTAIGTLKPAQVLVVGTGVVGLQAIATAKRLGGVVKALDIRAEACREAASLGAKVVEFDIPQDLAIGSGGYAKSLDSVWLKKEHEILAPHVQEADVVILSALIPGEVAPVLITDRMVASMKPGAVIMDVAIDQGGNCAVTEAGSFTRKHGVSVCGIENIPGRMAVHASWLYANNMYYYVENLFKKSPSSIDLDDEIVKSSLVTHESKIHHLGALKAMRSL